MVRRWLFGLVAGGLALLAWAGGAAEARADSTNLPRFYYYPYYYFPHNYWPTLSPQWPEPPGSPYMRPPAYMAYPPFREPNWRYYHWGPHKYYRGHHFWLDVF
ncbi:MAG TPA: hypothetical protein VIL46_04245 [Gemmataceae bacterium]